MKYYVVWIEGLEYKTGEKVKCFDSDGNIVYTLRMMDAMRVKEKHISEIKSRLENAGVAEWARNDNSFKRVDYAPVGTIYKTKSFKERQVEIQNRREKRR